MDRFGDPGAYEDFPDLPADWSSLQSEASPYAFGGGWENHFTDPFNIQASVVTDQDAMQGLVEELDISDQIEATEAGGEDDYTADIERKRQGEMDRQADLAGPAPGSLEADLAAVNMNCRRERAIERYHQFADGMASMTPGVKCASALYGAECDHGGRAHRI